MAQASTRDRVAQWEAATGRLNKFPNDSESQQDICPLADKVGIIGEIVNEALVPGSYLW